MFLNLMWHCFEGDLSYFISALLVFQLHYSLLKTGSVVNIPSERPCTAQTSLVPFTCLMHISIYSWIPSVPELLPKLNVTDIQRGKKRKEESPWLISAGVKILMKSRKTLELRVRISSPCLQSEKANYPEHFHNISKFFPNICQSRVMSQKA